MNTNRVLTATLLAATVLVTAPQPASATTTERERGIVLDCHGEAGGLEAHANLYENDTYGNVVEVVIGDLAEGNGRSKDVERQLLVDGRVRAGITIDGAKATIRGTASKVGRKKAVHEVQDDGGYLITIDGTHRRLVNDLVLTYDGQRVPLTCDDAFAYDLRVTREPIA